MEWTNNIQVLVLDMDGTLYQDESFIEPYISYLFQGHGGNSDVSMWQREAELILSGKHALKIGHFFSRSLKSGVEYRNGEIARLYNWEGKNLERSAASSPNIFQDIQYIGDAWGVVGAIADYADIPASVRRQAFMSIRRDMISTLNCVKPHDGVAAALRGLKSVRHKLLMTNSPEEAALDFVSRLGLDDAFDTIIYGGNKPQGLADYLQEYMNRHGISPDQVVSIGDNAWNDLYPVKKLGGRTIWISPYETYDEEKWDLRLRTLDELADFLLKLEEHLAVHP
ncbi:HAD family hydrolase [Paenibacillus fonticola]|uniref:HAD family hydrolase n=1 Tax=Paenibacillus fonticola TaxID=379896 RepID=UPI00035DEE6A|nr:HAD family hydrolase [Paenibacillus fonticola]